MSQRLTLTARRSSRFRGQPARIEIFGRFCKQIFFIHLFMESDHISIFCFLYLLIFLNQNLCFYEEMLKCQNVHIPKLWNKKLWEASNIPFLIFTIGFSNRAALYSWSVAGIPALLYKTWDELFCKNVSFPMEWNLHEKNSIWKYFTWRVFHSLLM